MAVPLRKVSGGNETLALAQRAAQKQPKTGRTTDLAPRRLVRREIRSNASYRRTIAWLFLGLSSLLFFMGISYTFVKAGVSRLNYQINTLQNENEQILLDSDKLRGQIAELRSLERIEERARLELGMVKNEKVEYMVLSSTIVAEGKLRPEEDKAEETQISENPLESVFDFILDRIHR